MALRFCLVLPGPVDSSSGYLFFFAMFGAATAAWRSIFFRMPLTRCFHGAPAPFPGELLFVAPLSGVSLPLPGTKIQRAK